MKDTAISIFLGCLCFPVIAAGLFLLQLRETAAQLPVVADAAIERELRMLRGDALSAITQLKDAASQEIRDTRRPLLARVDRLAAQADNRLAALTDGVINTLTPATAHATEISWGIIELAKSAKATADEATAIERQVNVALPPAIERWSKAGEALTAAVPDVTASVAQIAANSAKVTGDAATVSAKAATHRWPRWMRIFGFRNKDDKK